MRDGDVLSNSYNDMLESYKIIYGSASAHLTGCRLRIANTHGYRYVPSLVLSIIAIALFAIAFVGHVFLLSKYRTWYFIPIAIGTAMEIIGYIFRILSNVDNPYAVAYFVAQVLLPTLLLYPNPTNT